MSHIPSLADIENALQNCLRYDRFWLKKQFYQIQKMSNEEQQAHKWQTFEQKLHHCIHRFEARLAKRPTLYYPDLPVVAQKENIIKAIQLHPVVIVAGDTGSGKTTQLPKICLEAGLGLTGLIGHTQPRRLAAK